MRVIFFGRPHAVPPDATACARCALTFLFLPHGQSRHELTLAPNIPPPTP